MMYTVKLTTGETLTCRDVWQDFNEFHLTVVDKDGDYDLYCCIDEVESVTSDEEESTKVKDTASNETQQKEVVNNIEVLLRALRVGYIYYPIDDPDDCYKYRVTGMHYNPNYERYYIYVSDGVGELFAEDYGITWRI